MAKFASYFSLQLDQTLFFIHFALKQKMDKSEFLDKIYGLTPLEEKQIFDLF